MEAYDVIVIGGGPAGIISAVTAKQTYPEKKVLLIKSVADGVVPCGIPYMFATLERPEQNALGNGPLEQHGIAVRVATVTRIAREEKQLTATTEEGEQTLRYDKLVLATGSTPVVPPLAGIEKQGIYAIKKELGHLQHLKEDLLAARDVVIIGGGFIGVEFADELSRFRNRDGEQLRVTLVELLPTILARSFDQEFSAEAQELLLAQGVRILTGERVERFEGDARVSAVTLGNGETIPCQVAILGIGARPNTALAEQAGLAVGKGVQVDEYLRSSDPAILAVGDCAEKTDFFTRERVPIMLASTATAEARIAGANLFQLRVVRENKGTIATYSTKIGERVFASAGLTEASAHHAGFLIVTGSAAVKDKHPGAMPGAMTVRLKLVFSHTGLLLGGQVSGGESAGELVNAIGVALQRGATAAELVTLQVATHPKLTAPPTAYPLITAAQDALRKLNGG